MQHYCVNKQAQSNGDHEVHLYDCRYLPGESHQMYLGEFPSCREAVAAAKRYYATADGCAHCCPECHTS